MEKEIPTLQWTQTYSCGHSQTLATQYAPTSLPRKDEVPREGLLENLVGGKCCGRGLGSANALTLTWHSWAGVPKMGKGSQFCSWKEHAAALNKYRAFSVSDELQSFYMPTAALWQKNYPGDEVQTIIWIWDVLKNTWEVWDNFLFSESGTKIFYRF